MKRCFPLFSIIIFFLWGCPQGNEIIEKVDNSSGATKIESMNRYNELSSSIDLPGIYSQKEVKFVIINANSTEPITYFINSNKYLDHYTFLTEAVGLDMSMSEFKSKAYFVQGERELIVGELIYYNGYSDGLFTIEFWPTDLLSYDSVFFCFNQINDNLMIPDKILMYHPKGIIQESDTSTYEYENSEMKTVSTQELYDQFSFIPFHTGESYGVLRDSSTTVYDSTDIVLLRNIPNTLSHVSGIITEIPQTPLSHINLIARQNNIPNSYIKNVFEDERITGLIGKYVHYIVEDNSYTLEEASIEDVTNFLDKLRPTNTQVPQIDRDNYQILNLTEIDFENSNIYGSKTTNVAELGRILPEESYPDGFGVPFAYYIDFMEDNDLFTEAREMLTDPEFNSDMEYRKDALKAFRKKIKSGTLTETVINKFENQIRSYYPIGTHLRCRSSTNNEDLEGFSGAGLYESYTHKVDEGTLDKSIKQVWSGLWTFRAFQEREFYRVDHFQVAMAVLIHPNYKNEKSNGVAVTKNIFDSDYRGYYVNVQLGEDMVTNPQVDSIPEELLISVDGLGQGYGTEYIRYSNLVSPGTKILGDPYIEELTNFMAVIQDHFLKKYDQIGNNDFAMEIEFKVTSENKLIVKQARPWL